MPVTPVDAINAVPWKIVGDWIAFAAVPAVVAALWKARSADKVHDQLRKDLRDLREENTAYRKQVFDWSGDMGKRVTSLQETNERQQREISTLTGELKTSAAEKAELKAEVERLKRENEELRSKVNQLTEHLRSYEDRHPRIGADFERRTGQ